MVALAAALVLTGCTGSDVASPTPGPKLTPEASAPVRVAGLFVADSHTLGPIVIDGQGNALYRFDGDSPRPPRSTCVGECTVRWLPVPAAADLRVVGIDRQLVGTVNRPDGTAQLTLAGWPLYGYVADRMPGDTTGEGRDGKWYVIAPNGAKAFAG
jgi:predicted lipoprotein with Yx(FWY)xxD motif